MSVSVKVVSRPNGNWALRINHQGCRTMKLVGKDERLAKEIAEKIETKLMMNELVID